MFNDKSLYIIAYKYGSSKNWAPLLYENSSIYLLAIFNFLELTQAYKVQKYQYN